MATIVESYGTVAFPSIYHAVDSLIRSYGATLADSPEGYGKFSDSSVVHACYEFGNADEYAAVLVTMTDGSTSRSIRPWLKVALTGSPGLCGKDGQLTHGLVDFLKGKSLDFKVRETDKASADKKLEVLLQRGVRHYVT